MSILFLAYMYAPAPPIVLHECQRENQKYSFKSMLFLAFEEENSIDEDTDDIKVTFSQKTEIYDSESFRSSSDFEEDLIQMAATKSLNENKTRLEEVIDDNPAKKLKIT